METSYQSKNKRRRRSSNRNSVEKKKLKMLMAVGSSFSSSSSSSFSSSLNNLRYEPSSSIKDNKTELLGKDEDYNVELSEDVWFEILLRLPLDSIFKLKCVSKVWFSVLSNQFFMNRVFNSFNTNLPWALFYQHKQSHNRTSVSSSSVDLHSQFVSVHDGFSFKFLLESYPFKEKELSLLDSSNGLVLCSITLDYQKKYFVCNPLTKQWVSLPPPRNSSPGWVLDGLVCESSLVSTISYKVVRIPQFKDHLTQNWHLEIFFSDLGEWRTYQISCHGEVTIHPVTCNLVASNGVLYWTESRMNRIIAFDFINNDYKGVGKCSLINLPGDRGDEDFFCKRCLRISQGFICYAQIQRRKNTLSIYVLEEDASTRGWAWHLVDKIELNNMVAELDGQLVNLKYMFDFLRPLAFHPVDRNVVILGCDVFVLSYNIETRKTEVLRSPPSLDMCQPMHTGFSVFPFVVTPRPTTIPPPSWGDS